MPESVQPTEKSDVTVSAEKDDRQKAAAGAQPTVQTAAVDAPTLNFSEALRPAAGWKTALTKLSSGIVFAAGTVFTSLGVLGLVAGRSITGKPADRPRAAIVAAVGAVLTSFGVAGWGSAASATRTRNFAELQEKLSNQPSRGMA